MVKAKPSGLSMIIDSQKESWNYYQWVFSTVKKYIGRIK